MKKVFVGLLLVLATVGLCAQERGYFSILPGYQYTANRMDPGFVGSLDVTYLFSENVGLHFGAIYNVGKFNQYYLGMNKPFEIAEVGVEFSGHVKENGRLYLQLNAGTTVGLDSSIYRMHNVGTAGFTLGYRYFFSQKVGLTFQASYHKLGGGEETSFDARLGVTWRF